MKKVLLVLMLFLPLIYTSAQDFQVIKHPVELGETIRMISIRYKVEPSEIYRLNKFAIDGIREGMVLQILVPVKDEPGDSDLVAEPDVPADIIAESEPPAPELYEVSHKVCKGETLFSLSRRYNVPVGEIQSANEETLRKGLQTGQVLTIRTPNPN